VAESCPTKIFLANPEMDRAVYAEAFHLNPMECDLIGGLIPPGQMVICQPQGSKRVRLTPDAVLYWIAANGANENLKRSRYFNRYGFADGLRRLADKSDESLFVPDTTTSSIAEGALV
jgi:type IV secretion system protein VirB4